jgi:uncharacterized protein (DUF1501 family)
LPDQSLFDLQAVSRRRFIQGTAVTAGIIAASPYLSRLEAFAAPPVADNEGILITIFLTGGNDGLNMVAPVSDPEYAALRPTIKIANGHPVGSGLQLHPSLVKLKARFDQDKVAIVRGVGYQPADLSHFSSTDIWTHGWGGTGTPTTGWLGRYLDTLPNTGHESLYGVGLHGGVNAHLSGAVSQASSLPLHIGDAFGVNRSNSADARMYDALISLGSGSSGLGPLGDLYNETEMEFLQLAQRIDPAYGFPDQTTDIEQQLALAAHLINANLGIRVIDTALDGFDTHSDQPTWHSTLMGRLDGAIDVFYKALSPRWRSQVTIMTFSEFGRRADQNGDDGTDHGTAAPVLVIGDHVRGGLHGAQPSLTNLDNDGNLVPTVDFRAVYANILHTWLGVDDRGVLGKAYSGMHLFESGPAAPFTGSESGYWLAGPSGAMHGFGTATKFGPLAHVRNPIVAGAATPTHKGLWLTSTVGGVFCLGDAKSYGNTASRHLNKPITTMAATPTGKGYWLVSAGGGVFPFGDAKSYGTMGGKSFNTPVVAMAATKSGKGYWLVTGAGGVYCFGDAQPYGSITKALSTPIVDMCSTPTGKGYWLVASGGAVFAFGDAHLHGSHVSTSAPVVSIARSSSGGGYWLAAKDGKVGAFGDAPVLGGINAATAVLVRC